jgi:glutaredoxin 3
MTDEPNLLLYVKPGCPYCQKVQRFMDTNGIQIETRNLFEGDNLKDLMAIGGKNQAPCLIIDGKPLYESDDIIAYLQER